MGTRARALPPAGRTPPPPPTPPPAGRPRSPRPGVRWRPGAAARRRRAATTPRRSTSAAARCTCSGATQAAQVRARVQGGCLRACTSEGEAYRVRTPQEPSPGPPHPLSPPPKSLLSDLRAGGPLSLPPPIRPSGPLDPRASRPPHPFRPFRLPTPPHAFHPTRATPAQACCLACGPSQGPSHIPMGYPLPLPHPPAPFLHPIPPFIGACAGLLSESTLHLPSP
jgi:hypothetical protein